MGDLSACHAELDSVSLTHWRSVARHYGNSNRLGHLLPRGASLLHVVNMNANAAASPQVDAAGQRHPAADPSRKRAALD